MSRFALTWAYRNLSHTTIGATFYRKQNKSLAMSYSHMGTPTLPSALLRFTSEFGMGSGGTNALMPPGKLVIKRVRIVPELTGPGPLYIGSKPCGLLPTLGSSVKSLCL